jgi:endoglucanase
MRLRRHSVYLAVAAVAAIVIGTVMTVAAAGNGRGADESADASAQSSRSPLTDLHSSGPALSVRGNKIVNAHGEVVRLTGFNNSGAEYACEEGTGIFDAPSTNTVPAIVRAMKTWTGANAVRLPVNEQCWLGLPGVPRAYSGQNYRQAIEGFISELTSSGFAVILDLAGTAPGAAKAANQEEMPDSHSVAFWQSAATTFYGNSRVLFDLFNEPWPDNGSGSSKAWACWRDGGCIQESQNGHYRYRAVGMQQLVNVVRATGARNIIVAEGIQYAETIDRWLEYRPYDPTGNLISSVHVYSFNRCSNPGCYEGNMTRVAKSVPMLIGEFGPNLTVPYSTALDVSCPAHDVGNTNFDSTLLAWARSNGISWTAWTWNPWGDCWSLVRNFSGEPTDPYGMIVRSALRSERQSAHV